MTIVSFWSSQLFFFGGTPPCGITFQYPGAIHRARWMARAIYSLKMWLFRNQYEPLQTYSSGSTRKSRGPSYKEQIWKHLNEVCLFVTAVYIKFWFESPSPTAAPRNDLNLLRTLSTYQNKEIANVATHAFSRHLWYLSELLVGFSFFDDNVSVDEKKLMVLALKHNKGSNNPSKRVEMVYKRLPALVTKSLHEFVTSSTTRLFKILDLSDVFLQCDPSEWKHHQSYHSSQQVVQSVKVVNDLAERGVALIQ